MGSDYTRGNIEDFEPNPDRPGRRYELSRALGIDGYNLNVAVVPPGERLPYTGLHYHEDQEEFFYVLDGECRVEVTEDSFDLRAGEMVLFPSGTAHCIHNPFDDRCEVLALGHPPEGHGAVQQVQPWEELLAERYPERVDEPS